ncbi:glutathione S-transferase family protein, partial [Agrobacterium vitis]|nr:glutathione S-transferase family protein [Allorhizobium ampelinum]MCF1496377.1 glutathione S-transferase family protein [Allorhizobium ampelinum]
FLMTSEGAELIRQHANLQEWWARMASRPSMAATKPS